MAQTSTLTIRLPEASMERLEYLSKETCHSRAEIAAEAVEQYLDVHEWHVQSIKDAVKEADSPDAVFLDHDDVVTRMRKARKP